MTDFTVTPHLIHFLFLLLLPCIEQYRKKENSIVDSLDGENGVTGEFSFYYNFTGP